MSAKVFRWKYSDSGIGDQWSGWHVMTGPCSQCCCGGGPEDDGDHREPAEHSYVDGFLENGHSYCNPAEDDYREIEYKESAVP